MSFNLDAVFGSPSQEPLMAFRYSGSKLRELPLLRLPSAARIVEPYLGSGAVSLNASIPSLGYEANPDLAALWHWLITEATEMELRDLRDLVEATKHEKADVTQFGLAHGPETYIRVNCCSAMVGQLSSKRLYPQHRLPIERTIAALPRIRQMQVIGGDGAQYEPMDGDLAFLDPPYVGTEGNYKAKGGNNLTASYTPEHTSRLIERIRSKGVPSILTYGTGAPAIFPAYEWTLLHQRKVPNLRKGGTVLREEWVAYIPPQS